MACSSLRGVGSGVHFPGLSSNESKVIPRIKQRVSGYCPIPVISHENQSRSKLFPVLSLDLKENPMVGDWSNQTLENFPVHVKTRSIGVSRGLRWWEKIVKPNMFEISSAQQLVDSLLSAGDRLVVLDFYSPGCGGCKALHPKVCQLAESNQHVMFLKVNQEERRTMCHSLHIHVLPFFRFYRGAEGRVCSFSCTNATIKKFKDALAKHGTERCSLGPAKGLDDKELIALASASELPLDLPLFWTKKETTYDLFTQSSSNISYLFGQAGYKLETQMENAML